MLTTMDAMGSQSQSVSHRIALVWRESCVSGNLSIRLLMEFPQRTESCFRSRNRSTIKTHLLY